MSRNKVIALVAAVVVLAAAGVVGWVLLSKPSTKMSPAEEAWAHRTPEPIVKVDTKKQEAILPGASVAPTKHIEAFGKCAAALDLARALMKDYPSGLALDEAGSARENKAFAAMDKDCPADVAANFRSQEMMNWNNAAIPVRAGETKK